MAVFTPFEEVHQYILEKLQDSDICVGKKGSYLKVFQAALHYNINDLPNAKSGRNYFEKNALIHGLYFLFQSFKTGFARKVPLKPFVLIDGSRFEGDEKRSVYFEKIKHWIGPQRCTHIASMKQKPSSADYASWEVENRFRVLDSLFYHQFQDVRRVYEKAKKSERFTVDELDYLGACLHSFLVRYSKCLALYKNSSVQTVLFIVHYLNEGFIAAMQDLKIECIELQHGLISAADLYYVYDERYRPWIQNAFFPKKMWVYGDLWKKRMHKGIAADQQKITVAGDYTLFFEKQNFSIPEKENILLICTQKFLAHDYFPWIDGVLSHLSRHPDWKVIIKLHPKEREHDIARYHEYASDNVEIMLQGDLGALFAKTKIQLSIYSTTFYDAIGYDVVNFTTHELPTYRHYVQELTEEHIATAIGLQDDPIDQFLSQQQYPFVQRNMVYHHFPTSDIQSWLDQYDAQ